MYTLDEVAFVQNLVFYIEEAYRIPVCELAGVQYAVGVVYGWLGIHANVYAYLHRYIHMHMHMYIHTCIPTYIHTFIHAYIHKGTVVLLISVLLVYINITPVFTHVDMSPRTTECGREETKQTTENQSSTPAQ